MVYLVISITEDYGVRYVAITDNIDSDRGLDDMVAVRELFNEFYPRDTSKKIRAVFGNKGNNGERLCTQVPYGYVGDKHGWEIDPEAAPVVWEIFRLCLSGLGPSQIAKRITTEGHLNPSALALSRNKKIHNPAPIDPCRWATETVSSILERREYTGCTVNFKTHRKSYKNKKTIYNSPDQWKIFPALTRRLSTMKPLRVCRSCGRTSGGPRGRGNAVSFLGCCIARTAARKCITLPASGMTVHRSIFVAQNIRAMPGSVARTISGKRCFMIWCWPICGSPLIMFAVTSRNLWRTSSAGIWRSRKRPFPAISGSWRRPNGG